MPPPVIVHRHRQRTGAQIAASRQRLRIKMATERAHARRWRAQLCHMLPPSRD